MPTVLVRFRGEERPIEAREGETLLAALQRAGYRAPEAPCGGNATCGKCLVEVTGAVSAPDAHELDLLSDRKDLRLACCAKVLGDCAVHIEEAGMGAVIALDGVSLSFPLDPPAGRVGLGIAVDIGTTTVVAHLRNLSNGAKLGVASGMNRQRVFGADVISRINHANTTPGGLEQMTTAIREQLAEYAREMCQKAGHQVEEIRSYTIAGNTIMEHIFAGLSPASIAVAPFTPLSLFGDERPAAELGLPGGPEATVYLTPAVAGYVGGDITAGILASGAGRAEEPSLFLDIGTNGEMSLGTRDGLTSCATAAGPAFEGAEIAWGMSGVNGAISKVWLEDGAPRFSVIGDCAPEGICGSGLVDALAVLLKMGAVDETGRLLDADEAPEAVLPYLEEDDDGTLFRLDKASGVAITAGDVRKLQLAKAAVAAGIQTLLEDRGITEEQVARLYLAGGFGSYINKESAGAIGLLPPSLLSKTIGVGNSAGAGAVAALLSRSARAEMEEIQHKCGYLELSSNPSFTDHYIECMSFE